MLTSTIPPRISAVPTKIEAFAEAARNRHPKVANTILASIDEHTLTIEDRKVLNDTVIELCDERNDMSLPKGVEATLLRRLGVHMITNVTEYDWVDSTSVREIRNTLLDVLRYAEGVSTKELEAMAEQPLGIGGVVWNINHDLRVIFSERVEHWNSIAHEYGTGGELCIGWLPGVTTYNKETTELENFAVTLLPHGHTPRKHAGVPHLRGERMRARVVDGKLVGADVVRVENDPTANISIHYCRCAETLMG